MNIEVGGLFGLILLILDVFAIVKTIGSGASTGTKVLWVVVILLLPLLGLILWWLMGPKSAVTPRTA
jgi:phospholipase D-like protein